MIPWYEREEERLTEQLNSGEITRKEYDKYMREIRDELRGQAEEAAERAYDNAMGGW